MKENEHFIRFLCKYKNNFRVLGFTPLIYSSCNDTAIPANITETLDIGTDTELDQNITTTTPAPVIEPINDLRIIQFAPYNADYYLNPIFLILCYYTIALTSSLLLQPKVSTFKKLIETRPLTLLTFQKKKNESTND